MSFTYNVQVGDETYRVESPEELSDDKAYQEVLNSLPQAQEQPQASPPMPPSYGEQISQIGSNLADVYTETPRRIRDAALSVMDKENRLGQPQGIVEGFTDPSMLLRTAGEGLVPLVTEPISAGIQVAGRSILEGGRSILEAIPDNYERKLAETWEQATSGLKDTPVYAAGLSALNSGIDTYTTFKTDFPDAARDIEAVINIAEIYKLPQYKSPVNTKQTVFGKWSEEQDLRAAELRGMPTRDFLNDLITPKDTPSSRAERLDQKVQTGGLLGFNRNVYLNTPEEDEMLGVLFNIPEVNKKNTLVGNYNAIAKDIAKKGNVLEQQLTKASFVKINVGELKQDLKNSVEYLKENNPLISGVPSTVAEKIFNQTNRIIAKVDGTPLSILRARKELDAWLKTQPRDTFGDNANAYTVATREIRNVLNNAIENSLAKTTLDGKPIGVNVKFREALREQSLLYKVNDRLGEKAADEFDTVLGRLGANIGKLAIRIPTTPLGIFATISYGASAVALGPVAATLGALGVAGTAGYMIKRGAITPRMRESLSLVLRATDKAIKKTRNSEMRRSLALDRAAVVEALKLPLTTVDDSSKEDNRE